MMTIFRYRLRAFRGQILGWGIAMALLGLLVVSFYDTVVQQQAQFEQLLDAYPPAMSAFFGDVTAMATPAGYLSVEFFALAPIILGIFAVLAGSGLLVSDEENGTLDLMLAHPVSRRDLFIGRLLAFVAALAGIILLSFLGILVAQSLSTMLNLAPLALAWPFVSLFAVLLLFGMLALALSFLLPSRRLAASTAGFLLIASYFVTSLAKLNAALETLANLSPLNYYQSGDTIRGLNVANLAGLFIVAVGLAGLALWRFQKRDLRVGGESGWRFRLSRRAA